MPNSTPTQDSDERYRETVRTIFKDVPIMKKYI